MDNTYESTVEEREQIDLEYEMLDGTTSRTCLVDFGMKYEQPLNKTDTKVFSRLLPFKAGSNEVSDFDANALLIPEGIDAPTYEVKYVDVLVKVQKFAIVYAFTAHTELLHPRKVPQDAKTNSVKAMAKTADLIAFGQMRSCPNVVYTNGTTRAGLASTIGLDALRRSIRILEVNEADKEIDMIRPGRGYGTSGVEDAFPVFCHTDLVPHFRDIPGFTMRVNYGQAVKPTHKFERGAAEDLRVIATPWLSPYIGAGLAQDGTYLNDGSNNNVYSVIIMGKGAMGHISLKGRGLTGISPKHISSEDINHSNVAGQFGFVSTTMWTNSKRLNDNHMVVIETCAKTAAYSA